MNDPIAAMERALKILQGRDRSEAEVRVALNSAGFGLEVVDNVIDHLRTRHILDDNRLADAFTAARIAAFGPERIKSELLRRGVGEEIVEAVLETSKGREGATALDLLADRYDAHHQRAKGKAGRFLMGRGFSEDAVHSALNRFFGDSDSNSE